jgi:hypothetical protein
LEGKKQNHKKGLVKRFKKSACLASMRQSSNPSAANKQTNKQISKE